MNENGSTCLVCDQPARARGLCQSCYVTARRHIAHGAVSWDELEERGLAAPLRAGRPKNPFTKALEEIQNHQAQSERNPHASL